MDWQGGAELGGRAACPAERRGVGEAWGAGCAGAAVFTRVPSWGCAGGGGRWRSLWGIQQGLRFQLKKTPASARPICLWHGSGGPGSICDGLTSGRSI